MEIGKAVRHLRRKRDLTQNDLATISGYTQTHISLVETGKEKAGSKFIETMSECLNVPAAVIFWMATTEEDISVSKLDAFKEVKEPIDNLIKSIIE